MRVLTPYRLAFATPLRTARGVLTHREGLVLQEARGGQVGTGEAAPLPGWSEEDLPATRAGLEGRGPCPPSAAFALELLALDLEAQAQGLPLRRLLHPQARDQVPVSQLLRPGPLPAEGVVKVKVGAAPLAAELPRLQALAQALGPGRLRLDANQAWPEEEARAALDALAPLGLECLEEPLSRPSPARLAALRGRGVRLAADESMRNTNDLNALLQAGAVDAVVLKPMFIGGLRAALALALRAAAAGLGVIVTTALERAPGRLAAAHLAAAVPEGALWPCGLDTGPWLEEAPGTPDPTAATGPWLTLPRAPGLGLPAAWRPAA